MSSESSLPSWVEGLMGIFGFAVFGYMGGMVVGAVFALVTGFYDAALYIAAAGAVALPAYVYGKVWHEQRERDRRRVEYLAREVARLQQREREREQQEQ